MLTRILKIINYTPRADNDNGEAELEASWECPDWPLMKGEESPP